MKHLGTTATGQDIATQSQLGGGGGTSLATATLNVPAATRYAEVLVAVPASTATSKVIASLVPLLDAENDAGELIDTALQVLPVAEVGQVRFILSGNAPFVGQFTAHYLLTN